MSSKQEIDLGRRQISIRVLDTATNESEATTNDATTNKIMDNHKQLQRRKTLNKYKKFDKKRRAEVIFWCKIAIFLLAAGTCVASFTIPYLQKSKPRGLAMWQWSLLITVLLGGPLITKCIVEFILLFLDREFSAKENVIYYVVGLVESAWVMLWFTMILIAWLWIVDEPNYLKVPRNGDAKVQNKLKSTFPTIQITLIALILGSFLWLLKDVFLMVAKSSFHIRRFYDRIKSTLKNQYVIEALCGSFSNDGKVSLKSHSRKMTRSSSKIRQLLQNYLRAVCGAISRDEDYDSDKDVKFTSKSDGTAYEQAFQRKRFGRKQTIIVDLSCLEDIDQEDVSCWGMNLVIDMIRMKPPLIYKLKDSPQQEIDSEVDALNAANQIFESVIARQSVQKMHIEEETLENLLPEQHFKVSEVKKYLLEGADTRQIEKEVLRKWMVKAYKQRSSLVRALEANRRIFRTFNQFVDGLLVLFIFALWLIMIRVETRKVIFVVGTAIVGSAFIFGDTTKKILDNILFVFLAHPFDIGDCCLIDNTPVIIEEINIITTTALTMDNEMKHYANTHLATQSISNYTRSQHMGDFIEFPLNTDTPMEKIDIIKDHIDGYIKENSQYWYPEHHWVMELVDSSKMKMILHFKHTINYHEFRERQTRKSKLVLAIKDILKKLVLTAVTPSDTSDQDQSNETTAPS